MLMGPYWSIFDLMDSKGSFLVLIRLYRFYCVHIVPYAFLWVLMCP